MIITVLMAAFCFAFPPANALLMRRLQRLPLASPGFFGIWALGVAIGTTGALLAGVWPDVLSYGASGLTGLILWWWSRRKRRKVAKLIGEKSRAVLAKMARSMPRPSPRPVPQGARG